MSDLSDLLNGVTLGAAPSQSDWSGPPRPQGGIGATLNAVTAPQGTAQDPFYADVRRKKKVIDIYNEELGKASSFDPSQSVLYHGYRLDNEDIPRLDRRLQNEAPWLSGGERQGVTEDFRRAVPKAWQGQRLDAELQAARAGKYEEAPYSGGWTGFGLLARPTAEGELSDEQRYGLSKMPLIGGTLGFAESAAGKAAAARVERGEATDQDIQTYARMVHDQEVEAAKGTGRKIIDVAAGLPAALTEWSMLGGVGGAGRAAAQGVVSRVLGEAAAKGVTGWAAGTLGEAALRTAARPDVILQRASEQGVGKGIASASLENAVWSGIGGPTGQGAPGGLLGRAAAPVVAGEVGKELQYRLLGRGEGSLVSRLAAAQTPQEADRATSDFVAEATAMGLLGAGHSVYDAVSAASASRGRELQSEGLSQEAVRQQVRQEFQPLFDRLKQIEAEGQAGIGEVRRQTNADVEAGLRGATGQAVADLRDAFPPAPPKSLGTKEPSATAPLPPRSLGMKESATPPQTPGGPQTAPAPQPADALMRAWEEHKKAIEDARNAAPVPPAPDVWPGAGVREVPLGQPSEKITPEARALVEKKVREMGSVEAVADFYEGSKGSPQYHYALEYARQLFGRGAVAPQAPPAAPEPQTAQPPAGPATAAPAQGQAAKGGGPPTREQARLDRQVLQAVGEDTLHEWDLQDNVNTLRKRTGLGPVPDDDFAASLERLHRAGRLDGGDVSEDDHAGLAREADELEKSLQRAMARPAAEGRETTREEQALFQHLRDRIDDMRAVAEAGPGRYWARVPTEQPRGVDEAERARLAAEKVLQSRATAAPPEAAPEEDEIEREIREYFERRQAALEARRAKANSVPPGVGGEAPLRYPGGQGVQGRGPSAAVPTPAEAAEGGGAGGRAPAPAGDEAGGDELSGRDWLNVRAEARERLAFAQAEYQRLKKLHLDIRKELARTPANPRYPSEWQKLAHQDANSVKGLDTIAERLSRQQSEYDFYHNFGERDFGDDPIEAQNKLFSFLSRPLPDPPTLEQMEALARDRMIAERQQQREEEAGRGDEPEGAVLGEPQEIEGGVRFARLPGQPARSLGMKLPRTPNPAGTAATPGGQPAPPRSLGTARPAEALGPLGRLGRALRNLFNPASVSETAQATAGNLRQREAELTRMKEQALEALYDAKARLDRDVAAEKDPTAFKDKFLAFTDPYETGNAAAGPPEYQGFYDTLKRVKDQVTAELMRRGLLKNFIDNHLGHLWKDPNNASASPSELGQRVASRRSLSGAEGYRKQRTLPAWRDGFDAGLEPAFKNPIEAEWARLNEMYKSVTGHDFFAEEQAAGRVKYVPLGTRAPEGWVQPNDKNFRVYAPPEVDITTFFDKQLMEGLQRFARGIGAKLTTTTSGPPGFQIPGQPSPFTPGRPGEIATRFEAPEVVLAHEIGHEIDSQYPQLRRDLKNNAAAWSELESLADLRASGQVSQAYKDYLRSAPERIANLVAAYVHAPELLQNVAPHARQILENLLTGTPRLQDLMSVKPSLEVGTATRAKRIAGPQLVGSYYMPAESALLVDRHLTPGLKGSPLYDAWMGVANEANKWSLGLSAFHGFFTALNAQTTALEVAQRQALTGNFNRQALVNAVEGVLPTFGVLPAIHDYLVGTRMNREYLRPGSTDAQTAALLEGFLKGGGRMKMAGDYGFDAIERLRTAVRQKAGVLPVTGQALRAVSEVLAWPIMSRWVPRIKAGAWARMYAHGLETLGPNPSADAQRAMAYRAWQSVENRFGQLTYDNLFWDRTMRGVLHGVVRSVGWNAGTIGELGGAAADLPSSARGLVAGKGISPRLSYAIALPAVAAITGSMLQYLLTGKPPEDAQDAFFPRTGRANPDGTPERVVPPTYAKDVMALSYGVRQDPLRLPENAWHMAKGKANPALQAVFDWYSNEDWRGSAIRDPKDPLTLQVYDELTHVLGAGEPISVQAGLSARDKKAPAWQQVGAGAGVLPAAPSYIAKPFEQQRAAEEKRKVEMTPLEKKRKGLQRNPGTVRPFIKKSLGLREPGR